MEYGLRLMTGAQLEATRWNALSKGAMATADACLRELHRRWGKIAA